MKEDKIFVLKPRADSFAVSEKSGRQFKKLEQHVNWKTKVKLRSTLPRCFSKMLSKNVEYCSLCETQIGIWSNFCQNDAIITCVNIFL